MLPPNISGARQTSSGAGLKNFDREGYSPDFFAELKPTRRSRGHSEFRWN